MQAILALEDGRIFRGLGYGHPGECQGEVVFNTSLTGYQEIATDPSYAGQIVVLTNPQIGNYGTNMADNEAAKPYIEGLKLTDYRVRILDGGTEAVTRVLVESSDESGDRWTTVGVSPNIIDASFQALVDSITWKLLKSNAPA